MIRFLHGADFHLDSAFGALPPGQAAARRRESRELALRLADYVKEYTRMNLTADAVSVSALRVRWL